MPYYIDALENSKIKAWPGKYLNSDNQGAPEDKLTFINVVNQELAAARNLQNAWLSYQTVIEDQLNDIHAEIISILAKASAISGQEVPIPLQANLDYARCAVARLRADVFDCHWNYKINWSLHVNKTGIIPLTRVVKPTIQQYLNNGLGANYWDIFSSHTTRSGRKW